MITNISDFYEINKILRDELLTQTELPEDHVLNGLSIHGSQLEKRLIDQKFEPFKITDSIIVFQLNARNSSSNTTQTIEEDLVVTSSYSFYKP